MRKNHCRRFGVSAYGDVVSRQHIHAAIVRALAARTWPISPISPLGPRRAGGPAWTLISAAALPFLSPFGGEGVKPGSLCTLAIGLLHLAVGVSELLLRRGSRLLTAVGDAVALGNLGLFGCVDLLLSLLGDVLLLDLWPPASWWPSTFRLQLPGSCVTPHRGAGRHGRDPADSSSGTCRTRRGVVRVGAARRRPDPIAAG